MSSAARENGQDHVIKVMVVGDSISHGREGDWTWRYRIWEWFRQQDIRVRFVGQYKGTVPQDDPEPPHPPPLVSEPAQPTPPLRTDGGYAAGVAPEFLANSHHFSASGRQAYQAQWLIAEQVASYEPDFCFVQLGFNDLGWCVSGPKDTLASMKRLIDEARSAKPDLKFAVANVPHRTDLPGREDLPVNTDIYNMLLARWIPFWNSPESPIALVRFCENYSCGGTTSDAAYDGLHPNALGEYQLAQAFSRTLVSVFHLGRTELAVPREIPSRPLSTPTNFKAISAPSGIIVTWDPVYGAYGYELRVRMAGSADWPLPCYVAFNRYDTRYCVAGQRWEYQVRASGGDHLKSAWSGVVSAVAHTETAPGPRNIVTHATPTGFTISWEPPQGQFTGSIDRYGVLAFDRDEPGGFPCVNQGVRGEFAEMAGLTPGHHYNIAVETWTSVGGGLPAGARSVTVGKETPPVPVCVRPIAIDDTTIDLRWSGHWDAAGYTIWIRHVPRSNADDSDNVRSRPQRFCAVTPNIQLADSASQRRLLYNLEPSVWDLQFAVSSYNGNDESELSEWMDASQPALEEPSLGKGDTIYINLDYLPWFTRIWVVQELAVARAVSVLCGDELRRDEVKNAAHYIHIHGYGEVINIAIACDQHFPSLLESAAIPTHGCLAMASVRDQVQRSRRRADDTRNDLLKLLELTRPTQATGIRDKVIGLLGLCGRGGEPGSINIKPDYNVSAASLFHTTATERIRADGDLDVLSQVFHSQSSSNKDLPSWVPDFADFTRPPTLRSPRSHAAPAASASRKNQPITLPSFPTPRTLLLPHVWRLSRIAQLSPVLTPAHFDIFDARASAELFGVFKTMARPLKRYRNDGSVVKAFFHCLVAGYIEFTPWASGGRAQSPEILHHDHRCFYLRLMQAVTGVGGMPWNYRSAETYAKAAREKTMRRGVFVTEDLPEQKGNDISSRSRKLLGLGPEAAQVGDWVVVAEGGCVPLVVRKHDDDGTSGLENGTWRSMGECYVHGMMDGEVAEVKGIAVGPMILE